MDFFEHQENARRRTKEMVFLYCVAVALIILAIYIVTMLIFAYGTKHSEDEGVMPLWDPMMFLWVTLGTSAVIVLGTLYKVYVLSRGGGQAVAELLGGTPLESSARDPGERRLLNVVDEMAIASGIPSPRVYILDGEDGINAFAAGFTRADAVIGVTRGCVRNLSRDQLQGVIAHEFSNILNGDMRLNIRLIGVLNGILIIAIVGYWIFRGMTRTGRSSSRGKKGGGAAIAILLFGLALMIIGYIGVFFGKLIKSAVSRQREFLADASAVQFTRNPEGIAGALKKILGLSTGSAIQHTSAEEASHLFFSNALRSSWFSMMATHPPLDERIRRIDPSFTGAVERVVAEPAGGEESTMNEAAAAIAAIRKRPTLPPIPFDTLGPAVQPARVLNGVGAPTSEHLDYAAGVLASLPEALTGMLRDPIGAQTAVYALLVSHDAEVKQKQMGYLAENADSRAYTGLVAALSAVSAISVAHRIPVMDIALPALRRMDAGSYEQFRANVMFLVSADMEIDLFEYSLMRILVRNLDPVFKRLKRSNVKYGNLNEVMDQCVAVLATIARFGNKDEGGAVKAFGDGMNALQPGYAAAMPPAGQCSLETLDKVLETLALASASVKKRIVGACAACVASDGCTTIEEAELLRAVADSLDCPIPPFLHAVAA
jgi:Zn-dependent protease with chaperone function